MVGDPYLIGMRGLPVTREKSTRWRRPATLDSNTMARPLTAYYKLSLVSWVLSARFEDFVASLGADLDARRVPGTGLSEYGVVGRAHSSRRAVKMPAFLVRVNLK